MNHGTGKIREVAAVLAVVMVTQALSGCGTVDRERQELVGRWFHRNKTAQQNSGSSVTTEILILGENGHFSLISVIGTMHKPDEFGVVDEGRWRLDKGRLSLVSDGSPPMRSSSRVVEAGHNRLVLENSPGKPLMFEALRAGQFPYLKDVLDDSPVQE